MGAGFNAECGERGGCGGERRERIAEFTVYPHLFIPPLFSTSAMPIMTACEFCLVWLV